MNSQKVAVILDDQTWTYSELIEQIERIASHLYHLNIVKGQIVYQFVERSFEMICGLFSIMYVGGVYCPLNPTDPYERLVSLLEQTHGQYVLVHEKTRSQFPSIAIQHVVLPIGYPLPGIRCLLIDEQGQIISNMNNTNEIGQIHIGGQNSCFNSCNINCLLISLQDQLYLTVI
jgi:non-ribosomal peptide synthetase component F